MATEAVRTGWLETSELPEWDEFVGKHPAGSMYHSSAWKAALEESFGHLRGRVLVARETGSRRIVGGLTVYRVQSWLLGNRLVAVPMGTFADPLVRSRTVLERLLGELLALKRREGIRVVEVRLREVKPGELERLGWKCRARYRHHYIRLERSLDELKRSCSRTAVRRMMAKAEKTGIVVRRVTGGEGVNAIYQLYLKTRRKHNLPPIPYAFFEALTRQFGDRRSVMLLAVHGGLPVAGAIGFCSGDKFMLEYSGEEPGVQSWGGNQLLYWAAIECAVENGCELFSFGRTAVSNDGLLRYKRHWGTVEEDLPVMIDPDSKASDRLGGEGSLLYRVVRQVAARIPNPAFRRLGHLCYRHWG